MVSNQPGETLDGEETTDGGMTNKRSRKAAPGQGNAFVGDFSAANHDEQRQSL
jgi:hypothetical protein